MPHLDVADRKPQRLKLHPQWPRTRHCALCRAILFDLELCDVHSHAFDQPRDGA
jgi:hypothetical protein